nr:hypothetical protein [Armatimonadota bacterium]
MKYPKTRLLSVTLCLVFGLIAAVHAEEPPLTVFRGPADVANERPYHLLFLAFSPEAATTLPQGRSLVGV